MAIVPSLAPLTKGTHALVKFLRPRRVARTIFMGSAPHGSGQAVRGLEEMRIRLGVVQPGEPVAVFNDATKRLTDRLTHLYTRAQRYWYDTHPNLRRTMEDRAAKLEIEVVETEIVRRLRQQTQRRGDFKAAHPCPSSADVPDESTVRLVILPPTTGHQVRAQNSEALATVSEILEKRGELPRTYRNMLIFVAPDTAEWDSLERETRRYLAWDSIVQEVEALNLDANQRREAVRGKEQSNDTVGIRLNEAYSLAPRPNTRWNRPNCVGRNTHSRLTGNCCCKSRWESPRRRAAYHQMVAYLVKDGTGHLALERRRPY